MSSSNTIYLATGANRGIGRGLVTTLLQRPRVTVIAGVRDVAASISKDLLSLPTAEGSKVVLAKIDSNDHTTPFEAVKGLSDIEKIDVVIANAGISNHYGPASEAPIKTVEEHLAVNTVAPLALFQATWPLLQKSSKPIFVGISTGLATITDMGDWAAMQTVAYGSSKAALNYIIRRLHFEHERLIAFPLSPGWVQTDMGNYGAKAAGMEEAPVTLQQSVDGILGKIDGATREETSGTFQSFDETKYKW